MNRLTLQIDRQCFMNILQGKQKVEKRYVYPRNASRYVVEKENEDGTVEVVPKNYDSLYLINGRRKDAPRLQVEVTKAEFIILTDDDGNDLTFTENGEDYLVCQVWYHLGKILVAENCEVLNV